MSIVGLLIAIAFPHAPAKADSGLIVSGSSILQPDTMDQFDCTSSAIEVVRTDGQKFNYDDRLEITYRFPEFDPPGRQSPMIGFTKYTIPRMMGVPSRKESAALPYQLCTFSMPNASVTKMELHVHHKNSQNGLSDIGFAAIVVDILPRDTQGVVIQNLMDSCQINTRSPFFENNLLVSQTLKPRKSGGKFGIAGTLFRQGVAAPNTTLEFREQKFAQYDRLGRLLGKATTDSRGQFKFSSNLKKYPGSNFTTVEVYVRDQVVPLGLFFFAADEFQFDLDFDWSTGGTYYRNIFDWIPSPAGECGKAYAVYAGSDSKDDRRGSYVWMYAAKRVFKGAAGKPMRSVSEGFTSGSCYVSGHFRNGKWVRGYIRRC